MEEKTITITDLLDGKPHGDCWEVVRTLARRCGVVLPESAAMEAVMPARRELLPGEPVRAGDVLEVSSTDALVPVHVAFVLDHEAEVGRAGVRVMEGDQRPGYAPVRTGKLVHYQRMQRVRAVWRAAALEGVDVKVA